MSEQPWDFGTAITKQRGVAQAQAAAEDFVKEAYRAYAEAERAYRKALSARIVELRAAKVAATTCSDIARGEPHIADLKYASTVADGVRTAAKNAGFRHSADREAAKEFTVWSRSRDMAEGYGNGPANNFESPIGGRR